MRIYFAGIDRPSFLTELNKCEAKNILISYADYKKTFPTFKKYLDKYNFNILLDSGAYSAFTRGIKLDVREYAEFIQQHKKYFERYFNLDDIEDFENTWNNQDYLESQGLKPVPVFHYGEPLELLRMMVRQYDFIGLGGMVPIPNNKLDAWLSQLLFDRNGDVKYPNVKFHALGLSTSYLLRKYPFYSCDSTKWLVGKKFGWTLYKNKGRGKDDNIIDKMGHNINWHLELEKELNNPREYETNLRLF